MASKKGKKVVVVVDKSQRWQTVVEKIKTDTFTTLADGEISALRLIPIENNLKKSAISNLLGKYFDVAVDTVIPNGDLEMKEEIARVRFVDWKPIFKRLSWTSFPSQKGTCCLGGQRVGNHAC